MPGSRLSRRYELHRLLEADSRVMVWEGIDTMLERTVLIRLLRPELARDLDEVERFREDVRVAARGALAAGERVLDAGEADETSAPFVVLEWPYNVRDERTLAEPRRAPPRVRLRRDLRGLAIVLLLVPIVIGVVLVRGLFDRLSGISSSFQNVNVGLVLPTPVAASRSQNGPTSVVQPTAQPTPVPQPPPQSQATRLPAVPTPDQGAVGRGRIVNTDGIGVALRASPGGPRLPGKGYDEGVIVTVVGRQDGWTHIRGDDGREGWILAVTLASLP